LAHPPSRNSRAVHRHRLDLNFRPQALRGSLYPKIKREKTSASGLIGERVLEEESHEDACGERQRHSAPSSGNFDTNAPDSSDIPVIWPTRRASSHATSASVIGPATGRAG